MRPLATLSTVAAIAVSLFATSAASAASLSLIYQGDNAIADDGAIIVSDGDILTFTVFADFSGPGERTIGGAFDINFDPAQLALLDYMQECGENDWCSYGPIVDGGVIQDQGFGSFNGYDEFEGSQMTFRYVGSGGLSETLLTTAATTNDVFGPFISAFNFLPMMDVDYFGVTLREVPVPGALWLFASGLAMLRGLRFSPRSP